MNSVKVNFHIIDHDQTQTFAAIYSSKGDSQFTMTILLEFETKFNKSEKGTKQSKKKNQT